MCKQSCPDSITKQNPKLTTITPKVNNNIQHVQPLTPYSPGAAIQGKQTLRTIEHCYLGVIWYAE